MEDMQAFHLPYSRTNHLNCFMSELVVVQTGATTHDDVLSVGSP